MDNGNLNLNNAIKEIVEAQIKVGVMQALQPNAERIIAQLIHSTLNSTVKENYTEYKFLDFHLTKILQEQVKAAVAEWAKDHADEVRKLVRKRLGEAKFTELITKKLTDEMLNVSVNVAINSPSSGRY